MVKAAQHKTDERLLSMRELADYLGVSYDTVREWRRRGRGPVGFRIGKHVRYDPDEVRRWLATKRDERTPA